MAIIHQVLVLAAKLRTTLKAQMIHCIIVAIAMMSGFYASSVLLMHIDPILCIGFRYVAHLVHCTWLIQGLAMEQLIL